MAPKAETGSGGAKGSGNKGGAAAAATAAGARVPTWQQRAVVAIYVYFIPVLLALNVAMLLSRWTAIPWLM